MKKNKPTARAGKTAPLNRKRPISAAGLRSVNEFVSAHTDRNDATLVAITLGAALRPNEVAALRPARIRWTR